MGLMTKLMGLHLSSIWCDIVQRFLAVPVQGEVALQPHDTIYKRQRGLLIFGKQEQRRFATIPRNFTEYSWPDIVSRKFARSVEGVLLFHSFINSLLPTSSALKILQWPFHVVVSHSSKTISQQLAQYNDYKLSDKYREISRNILLPKSKDSVPNFCTQLWKVGTLLLYINHSCVANKSQ